MKDKTLTDRENLKYKVDNFSANNFCNDNARKALEDKYFDYIEVTDKFDRKTVSFQLNKTNVLHRWLKYKEGFSAELVETLLREMNLESGSRIMDPFIGSGTTALVCRMMNYDCTGYDILPTSKLAIEVKANVLKYNTQEIERLIEDFVQIKVPQNYSAILPYTTITKGAYPLEADIFVSFATDWIRASDYSVEVKNLFRLSVLNSLEEISYTSKSGQYLSWDYRAPKVIELNKKRLAQGKKELPINKVRAEFADPQKAIASELEKILNDIKAIQSNIKNEKETAIDFFKKSALFELPSLPSDSISGVITSPPYCNRYDYTRTYALELAYLGVGDVELKKLRQTLLSCTVESHSKLQPLKECYKSIDCEGRFEKIIGIINASPALKEVLNALNKRKENGDLNNNGVIRMVEGYFTELTFIYAELYRVCKKGATVAFVNDNVRYGGEVIPVDFISTSLAENIGFKVKKIYVIKQQKGNSSQQMAKYGRVPLRKSITVWCK